MKIALVIGERRIDARLPYQGADHVLVDETCPDCEHDAPTKLRGRDQRHSHSKYHAIAVALCCGARIGQLEVEVQTVFGIEEDRRVLAGPWRVY